MGSAVGAYRYRSVHGGAAAAAWPGALTKLGYHLTYLHIRATCTGHTRALALTSDSRIYSPPSPFPRALARARAAALRPDDSCTALKHVLNPRYRIFHLRVYAPPLDILPRPTYTHGPYTILRESSDSAGRLRNVPRTCTFSLTALAPTPDARPEKNRAEFPCSLSSPFSRGFVDVAVDE